MKKRPKKEGNQDITGLLAAKAVTDRDATALELSKPTRTELEPERKDKIKMEIKRGTEEERRSRLKESSAVAPQDGVAAGQLI